MVDKVELISCDKPRTGTVHVADPFAAFYRGVTGAFDAFFISPPYNRWSLEEPSYNLDPLALGAGIAGRVKTLINAIHKCQELEKNETYAVYLFVPLRFYLHVWDVAMRTLANVEKYTWIGTTEKIGRYQFANPIFNLHPLSKIINVGGHLPQQEEMFIICGYRIPGGTDEDAALSVFNNFSPSDLASTVLMFTGGQTDGEISCPDELARWLIQRKVPHKPDAAVCDVFARTGSIGRAALQFGYSAVFVEPNPEEAKEIIPVALRAEHRQCSCTYCNGLSRAIHLEKGGKTGTIPKQGIQDLRWCVACHNAYHPVCRLARLSKRKEKLKIPFAEGERFQSYWVQFGTSYREGARGAYDLSEQYGADQEEALLEEIHWDKGWNEDLSNQYTYWKHSERQEGASDSTHSTWKYCSDQCENDFGRLVPVPCSSISQFRHARPPHLRNDRTMSLADLEQYSDDEDEGTFVGRSVGTKDRSSFMVRRKQYILFSISDKAN